MRKNWKHLTDRKKGVVKRKGKGGEALTGVIRNVDWHFSPICDKVFTFNALLIS